MEMCTDNDFFHSKNAHKGKFATIFFVRNQVLMNMGIVLSFISFEFQEFFFWAFENDGYVPSTGNKHSF